MSFFFSKFGVLRDPGGVCVKLCIYTHRVCILQTDSSVFKINIKDGKVLFNNG